MYMHTYFTLPNGVIKSGDFKHGVTKSLAIYVHVYTSIIHTYMYIHVQYSMYVGVFVSSQW